MSQSEPAAQKDLPHYLEEALSENLESLKNQNGYFQYINKEQVLLRMWRKGNPRALLMGIQIRVATLKSSMEFLQKIKNGTSF